MFQVDVFHNTSTFSAICTVFIEMKLLLLLLLKISNAIKQQTPEKTARTGKIILTVFILVAAICISIRKQMYVNALIKHPLSKGQNYGKPQNSFLPVNISCEE